MLQEDIVLPRATEPPFLSALHAKNETNAEQTFLAINLANQQKTKKVHFSSEVRKQFKLLTVYFIFYFYFIILPHTMSYKQNKNDNK